MSSEHGLLKKLTVLTRPIGRSGQIQGHAMVTRSLLAGLTQLGIPFNYNPSSKGDIGDVIVVLANVDALAQAIAIKRENRSIILLAGPNLVVWPTDDKGILLSSEIDGVIVPSGPTRHMYAEISPSIKDRLFIWYAGIDTNQWKPFTTDKGRDVLVYWKNQREGQLLKNNVVDLLKKYNWNPVVLEYGRYNQNRYKEILNSASFGIFLSRSESQGIALAEAWAMDVVTFPWNPKYRVNRGRVYSAVSSCPYLTDQTGKDWKEITELECILKDFDRGNDQYSPRQWILGAMTDAISAQLLIDIVKKFRQ